MIRLANVHFIKSASRRSEYPKSSLPTIAFAGRSNVGKSSLINCLVRRKRLARTSSTPGRTQLINFFQIGSDVVFVDLPGYGYARAPKQIRSGWGEMVEDYFQTAEQLCLTFLLVDCRHEAAELDLVMNDWLDHQGVQTVIVATKADKLSRSKLKRQVSLLEKSLKVKEIVPFSSATGMGRNVLWRMIDEVLRQ